MPHFPSEKRLVGRMVEVDEALILELYFQYLEFEPSGASFSLERNEALDIYLQAL